MVDQRLKDLRGSGRRDFLRWSATVAAVLGLERARYLNVINDTAGSAMADVSSCSSVLRTVSIVDGNGGFANWQLIFPHVAIATGNNANYAFHAMGKATMATGTDKPLAYAPESPFQKLGPKKQISAFMAGNNETHTGTPTSASTVGAGINMLASIAAIQTSMPTLLPVIGIQPFTFGAAPGAPAVATVQNAAGMVGLFDSAASKALLSTPANASLHEAYYKAFLGLNAAAGRSTVAKGYNMGKVAANLLGQNLSNQLRPTAAEQAAYGLTAGTATNIANIGNALITAAKAFKLGLTSMVIISGMRNDPHGLFGGGDPAAQAVAASLGKILDGFMAQMASSASPTCASKTLADEVVLTIHGDTPKDPRNRGGWPDGTPNNSNWLYVYGNGYLKTGWFGGVDANAVRGFDPATGNDVAGQSSATTANAAAAAALYAVAKGDMRRVQDFYRGGSIDGIVNLSVL
jgi:hypothetical protein